MRKLPLIFLILLPGFFLAQNTLTVNQKFKAMGSAFEITLIGEDRAELNTQIDLAIKEIDRIEKLISSWDSNSQTSMINQNAGEVPVKVDKELFDLIFRSIKISDLTNGAFDISFASIDKIWTFDGSEIEQPDSALIESSVENINYRNIILDHESHTVFLKNKGMKIGFGGIGKGYAAMKAASLLKTAGYAGGLVNAGGDLYTWGLDENNKPWKVAVADPKDFNAVISWLQLTDQSIVTSGDYEKYLTINGQRFAHIIDPRTGWPARGLKSVSVICPDAELADALATSIFVMGKENGLYFINQLKGVECILVDDMDQMHVSSNLNLVYE